MLRCVMTCLLALGCISPARGQITYFTYTNATITNYTGSAFMGFNPATGTFQTGPTWGVLSSWNASFMGNNVNGAPVSFFPWNAVGASSSNPIVFTDPDGPNMSYVPLDTVIDSTMEFAFGSASLSANLSIGDTSYILYADAAEFWRVSYKLLRLG